MATRFDLATGQLARPRRRGNGSVVYDGRIARTGPHQYPGRVERRDAAELARIARQMTGVPVTMAHPRGLIRDGAPARIIGAVENARVDGDFVVAEIRVDDMEARREIERGTRELSLGYSVDMDGEWQRNTRVDHLAFVDAARCGDACSVRVDCESEKSCLTCSESRGRLAEHAAAMSVANRLTARITR